jgi:hypothetical protein
MAREIKSAGELKINSNEKPNEYKDRLVKLIPSEIITAYVTIYALVSGAHLGDNGTLMEVVIAVLFVLTPVYLIKISKVTKKEQVAFSTFGFLIWVVATGSPLTHIGIYPAEFVASIVLIIYTLFIPLIYKG